MQKLNLITPVLLQALTGMSKACTHVLTIPDDVTLSKALRASTKLDHQPHMVYGGAFEKREPRNEITPYIPKLSLLDNILVVPTKKKAVPDSKYSLAVLKYLGESK